MRATLILLGVVLTTPLLALPEGRCLTCDKLVGEDAIQHQHRGRDILLCGAQGCRDAWESRREELFAKLQPKGALFQEAVEPRDPMSGVAFWLGLYVLSGLLFGAAGAYVAVNRSQAALPWFFVGFLGSAIGFVAALAMIPQGSSTFGVPPGLTKVPSTHDPVPCPQCGTMIHPSANACSRCEGSRA